MKKIKNLILILLVMMTILPFNVTAEKEKPETNKEPVKVYIFHGSTCSYCKAAFEWFDSIEEEYGDYFDLVDYEVWGNSSNQQLMEEIAEFKGDSASGVPYILVGEFSYPNGFGADSVIDSNTNQTMGDQLIERILTEYQKDNRYDVMVEINNKPNYDNVVAIGAGVIVVGLVAVAVISRRQNS